MERQFILQRNRCLHIVRWLRLTQRQVTSIYFLSYANAQSSAIRSPSVALPRDRLSRTRSPESVAPSSGATSPTIPLNSLDAFDGDPLVTTPRSSSRRAKHRTSWPALLHSFEESVHSSPLVDVSSSSPDPIGMTLDDYAGNATEPDETLDVHDNGAVVGVLSRMDIEANDNALEEEFQDGSQVDTLQPFHLPSLSPVMSSSGLPLGPRSVSPSQSKAPSIGLTVPAASIAESGASPHYSPFTPLAQSIRGSFPSPLHLTSAPASALNTQPITARHNTSPSPVTPTPRRTQSTIDPQTGPSVDRSVYPASDHFQEAQGLPALVRHRTPPSQTPPSRGSDTLTPASRPPTQAVALPRSPSPPRAEPPPAPVDPALQQFRSTRTFRTRTNLQLQPYTRERQEYEAALRRGGLKKSKRAIARARELTSSEDNDPEGEESESSTASVAVEDPERIVIGESLLSPHHKRARSPIPLIDADYDEYYFQYGGPAQDDDEQASARLQKIAKARLKAAREEKRRRREQRRREKEFEAILRRGREEEPPAPAAVADEEVSHELPKNDHNIDA